MTTQDLNATGRARLANLENRVTRGALTEVEALENGRAFRIVLRLENGTNELTLTGDQVDAFLWGTSVAGPRWPIGTYLDLSTSHLTLPEMDVITSAPPRVIAHEYGAWVHVEHDDAQGVADVDERFEEDDTFPNLHAAIKHARTLGVNWINFDRDGETIDALPTFQW